jgi:hypothetical protein
MQQGYEGMLAARNRKAGAPTGRGSAERVIENH